VKGIALSHDKKRYLLHIYLTQGYSAAKPLAIKYGVSPRVMSKYSLVIGIKGKRGREIGKWKGVRKPPSSRWETAVERGSITI
jgi:hypothetical protein